MTDPTADRKTLKRAPRVGDEVRVHDEPNNWLGKVTNKPHRRPNDSQWRVLRVGQTDDAGRPVYADVWPEQMETLAAAPNPATAATKVERGWYANADGTIAAVSDGYTPGRLYDETELAAEKSMVDLGLQKGVRYAKVDSYGSGGEWVALVDLEGRLRQDPEVVPNLDWYPTKREALEAAARELARLKAQQQRQ